LSRHLVDGMSVDITIDFIESSLKKPVDFGGSFSGEGFRVVETVWWFSGGGDSGRTADHSGCCLSAEAAPQPEDRRRRDFAQQLQQVGSRSGEDRVDGVSRQALEKAADHPVVTFKMADLRFHRTASFTSLLLSSCQPASTAAGQMNGRLALVIVTAIAFVDKGIRDGNAGNPFGRGDHSGQCVSVVRIAFAQIDADDPVAAIGCRHRHLLTELVPLVSLAFADAYHLGFVQAVEFLLICALLSVEPFAQLQQFFQSGIWRRHLATDITDDSPQPRS